MSMMNKIVMLIAALFFEAGISFASTISYSVPVLSVRSDGVKAIAGSGALNNCPFVFNATTNTAPVKVSIVEDVPSGAGNSLRASFWLAVTTASLILNRDLAGATINFETSGYVDGPSAGGMLCLAVMSAMESRSFPDDFAMTGTIMADGTVGPVGGVAEKIRAAGKAGIKRICIPASTRLDDDLTDLLALGEELKIEMHQVATISDAYQVLHKLPARLVERLNPLAVCRLPAQVEEVLKDRYVVYSKEMPPDEAMWNRQLWRSFRELRAGQFGVAAIDVVQGLEEHSFDSLCVQSPYVEAYPVLEHELPTNGMALVGKLVGSTPTKKQFIDALKAFHRDLKNAEADLYDDAEIEDPLGDPRGGVGGEKTEDWFDDYVESPSGAQFATLANVHYAKMRLCTMTCHDITHEIDSVLDWNVLNAGELNEIRARLTAKLNLIIYRRSLEDGNDNYERLNLLYKGLSESTPYIRHNDNVRQVENAFYRTMKAMDSALKDIGLKENCLVNEYRAVLSLAEDAHETAGKSGKPLVAVFSEAQALAGACALAACEDPAFADNVALFSSVLTTARENALSNIAECQKLGIPCVMPIVHFQVAESRRDDISSGEDEQTIRFSVLGNYLEASLSAKALVLCFRGKKPELNKKGYCCKSSKVNMDTSSLTVTYLGVEGKPILRDGFSGFWRQYDGDNVINTSWLDIDGRAVRIMTTNQWYTLEYDAFGRQIRQVYCNAKWEPTPRGDGVLYETFGHDADGNQNLWEFFGVTSNHVICADGVAIIKSRFNKRGQEIWRRFYDDKGKSVIHKDGDAGFDISYDKKGNQRRFTFVDCTNAPVMSKYGYAILERKYNANDLEIEIAWYDEKSKLVSVGGIAKICRDYDEMGNNTAESYFGADSKPVRCAENYATVRWKYNRAGNAVGCRYFGTDNKPTADRAGVASWEAEVDPAGRIIGRKYFDLVGKEIVDRPCGK